MLAEADLGSVDTRESSVTVRYRLHEVTFSADDPWRVTLAGLHLETTSVERAILCCDALAPSLGPMLFRGAGVELLIDGTKPRSELEREAWDLQLRRRHSLQKELDHLRTPPPPSAAPKQYVN
jgi:hypothetical protein